MARAELFSTINVGIKISLIRAELMSVPFYQELSKN